MPGRKDRGHSSLNHVEPENAKYGGFRVKIAVTISAAGQFARLVVIVSGLNNDELKMDDDQAERYRGVCVIKVEGLSMNGTICPTSKDYGYIVFLLRDCKAEEGRHLFYDEMVLQVFIKSNIVRRRLVNGIPVDAPKNSDNTVAT